MIAWIAENMIWASMAMLVVLAVRRPVASLFGAGAAYALWFVPALRLVAPPGDWFAPFASPLPPLVVEMAPAVDGAPLPPDGGPGQWLLIILAVWAGGAFLFLLYQGRAYRRFLKGLSLSLRSAGSFGGVPVMASGAVEGPLALGLFDRRIVVPADFETRYSQSERLLALAHEAYHHRRRDIAANHFALLILALNWFNPIAWFAFRAFRADQELSCDAAVAAAADLDTRCDYARALVKSASQPGLIAACPLNHADQLKRRLKMLNHHRKSRGRTLAGAGLTVVLVATSMAFGAPGYAQEKEDPKERRVIIMEHHEGAEKERRVEHRDVIRRNLSPEMAQRLERCENDRELVNVDDREGERRTRILLCADGDGTPASQVEALQRARSHVSENEELSAATKQRIMTQIDAAIARARQGQ